MKRHRFLVAVTAAVVGAVPAAMTVTAASAITTSTPTVVSIRAAHHPGYDRLVFQMTSLPTQRSVRYVTQVLSDPKGSAVTVAGKYFAVLRLFPARAHNDVGTFTTPARVATLLPNLREVVRIGDFEGVLSYALGLQQQVPLHVFTLTSPPRVVVDIPVLTWPVLVSGSTGSNVLAAQYLLRARGYAVAATGFYGSATRAAVIAFERSRALPLNGTIGAREWPRLIATVRLGSAGNAVRALQVELRKTGFAIVVDGSFGPLTLAAVKSVQKANALFVDGVVGPMTWMTLVSRHNGG
jgi:hypothetical protein